MATNPKCHRCRLSHSSVTVSKAGGSWTSDEISSYGTGVEGNKPCETWMPAQSRFHLALLQAKRSVIAALHLGRAARTATHRTWLPGVFVTAWERSEYRVLEVSRGPWIWASAS